MILCVLVSVCCAFSGARSLCAVAVPVAELSAKLLNDVQAIHQGDIIEWRCALSDSKSGTTLYDSRRTPTMHITDSLGQVRVRHAFISAAYVPSEPTDTRAENALRQDGALFHALRHSSQQTGVEHWQLRGADGVLANSGSYTVLPARSHKNRGILRKSLLNKRLLSFADGSIFIPVGTNIAWANAHDRLTQHLSYIRHFASNGGNHIRLWMCSWSMGIQSDVAGHYRLDHAYMLDRILQFCRQQGVYVSLVLDNHHDLVHGKAFPYGDTTSQRIAHFLSVPLSDRYQQRLHYIVARYGCDQHIMNWELFNELDEALFDHAPPPEMGNLEEICARWIQESAAYLRSIDDDQHLISSSLSWAQWNAVMAADGLDLVQVHSYVPAFKHMNALHRDGVLPLHARVEQLTSLGLPYCFSELGYQGSNEYNDGHHADPTGILLQQQLWAGFCLGGYGSGMNWWWDTYIEKNNLWHIYHAFAHAVQQIDWQDRMLEPLQVDAKSSLRVSGWRSSTQALLWPQLRTNTWYYLCVEQQPPEVFAEQHLVLRDMHPQRTFHVTWMQQHDGSTLSTHHIESDATGRLVIACPTGHHSCVVILHARAEE